MSVSHKDHGGIAMTPAIAFGRLHQPLDLVLGQILPPPQVAIKRPSENEMSLRKSIEVVTKL